MSKITNRVLTAKNQGLPAGKQKNARENIGVSVKGVSVDGNTVSFDTDSGEKTYTGGLVSDVDILGNTGYETITVSKKDGTDVEINVYDKSQVDAIVGEFGSFMKVPGTGADNHPDVDDPSPKVIYLVEVPGTPEPDHCLEWIWEQGSGKWECIGTTSISVDLELDPSSDNPVSNGAVCLGLDEKADKTDFEDAVSALNDEIADLESGKADRATTLAGYGITDAKIENTASNTVVTLGSNTLTVGMSDGRVNTIDNHTLFAERSTNDATGREIAPNLVPEGRVDGTMLSVVEDGGVVSMSWDTGHPVTVKLHLPDTYYNPLGLPPFTIRLRMVDSSVTPTGQGTWSRVPDTEDTWDCTYNNTSWSDLFYYNTGIKAVLGANTEGVLNMSGTFGYCKNMESVALFDTSAVTNAQAMFLGCATLSSVPFFDTGSVNNMGSMFNECAALQAIPHFDTRNVTTLGGTFYGCKSLASVPLLDTRNVTSMNIAFGECSSLVTIPLFDTYKVTNVTDVFVNCVNVEAGMLALYEQLSGQSNPPNLYRDAFSNCGTATEQGRAELAQIPSSWGGTAT